MTDNERKWRSPKQWYEEEYRPKTWWDYAYRTGADRAFATLLLASSFLVRYTAEDRWTWPTWRDVLISSPLMLIGAAIWAWHLSPASKRREARMWGWHDSELREVPGTEGVRHQATCKCGWEGPLRVTRDEAMLDQVDHRLAEERTRTGDDRKVES